MDEIPIRAVAAAFANHLPVRVRFGVGIVAELGRVLDELGATRVAAIVDPAASGPVAAALDAVSPIGVIEIEPGEPTIESVQLAGDTLAGLGARGVVAIGGGSALDTAKGARLRRSRRADDPQAGRRNCTASLPSSRSPPSRWWRSRRLRAPAPR